MLFGCLLHTFPNYFIRCKCAALYARESLRPTKAFSCIFVKHSTLMEWPVHFPISFACIGSCLSNCFSATTRSKWKATVTIFAHFTPKMLSLLLQLIYLPTIFISAITSLIHIKNARSPTHKRWSTHFGLSIFPCSISVAVERQSLLLDLAHKCNLYILILRCDVFSGFSVMFRIVLVQKFPGTNFKRLLLPPKLRNVSDRTAIFFSLFL